MTRDRLRKVGIGIAAGLVVLLLVVGLRRADSSQHWLRQARLALQEARYAEAQQYAVRLEAEGQTDEAHLLRGEICLRQGRDLMQQRRRLLDLDRSKQVTDLILVTGQAVAWPSAIGSGVRVHDPILWQPLWALGPFAEQRRAISERAEAALTEAVRELSALPDEGAFGDQATPLLAEAVTYLRELGRSTPLVDLTERLRAFTLRYPDHVEAHRRLAQFYIDLNALARAASELQEVARLDPADGRPWRFLGLIYRDTLREGAAIDAYREALQRRLEAHVAAEVREELAQVLVEQGFPQAAVEVLEAGPTWLRNSVAGRTLEAAARWGLHQRTEARRLVALALEEDPHHVPALRLAAQMELDEDEPEKAEHLLRRALELKPHDEKARHLLADALRAAGRTDEAEAQLRHFAETVTLLRELARLGKIAHNEPGNVEVRLQAARLLVVLGRPSEARNWVRSALAADPGSAEARRLLRELGPAAE